LKNKTASGFESAIVSDTLASSVLRSADALAGAFARAKARALATPASDPAKTAQADPCSNARIDTATPAATRLGLTSSGRERRDVLEGARFIAW
jgi:hypothetical protein